MKVVVTGGNGFVGKWLIKELLKNNDIVYSIVRNNNKIPKEFLNDKNFYYIEMQNEHMTDLKLEDIGKVDCFYHLAWGGVSPEYKNDLSLQLKNINLAIEMMDLSNYLKANKFISAGTVAEYAFSEKIIDLSAKQTPNDYYGAAKVSTHYFLDVKARRDNCSFIWAMLPSTFGEGRLNNNIITYTIRELIRGNKPKYGNLNQMWDFLYVADVADALRKIGLYGKKNALYGIGSGIYRPLKEYIYEIRDIINPEAELGIGDYPELSNVTLSSCVNIEQLKKDTGFYPKTTFAEGIKKTIDYMKCIEKYEDRL